MHLTTWDAKQEGKRSTSVHGSRQHRCDGVSRRDVLRVGVLSAVGISLTDALRADQPRPRSSRAAANSCILVWLDGGPSHLETFDPKPDAPREIRGPFGVIPTALPGVCISQLMPEMARLLDRVTVIRSMTSPLGEHDLASHYLLTGFQPTPVLRYPSIGSAIVHVRPTTSALPSNIAIPTANPMNNAGFLDAATRPFHTGGDPASADFRIDHLDVFPGLDGTSLQRRQAYLRRLESRQRQFDENPPHDAPLFAQAFRLLTSPQAKQAFDLSQESSETRQRYGMRKIGQSCLLARRLVERGVRFVTVHDEGWDTHDQMVTRLRDGYAGADVPVGLIPALDRALAALLLDLRERGMLEETLVVVMGEFGRTPKVNSLAGRDHWPRVFSVLLAGGGVTAGHIVGASDAWGESPVDDPVRPQDLACTIYRLLGITPHRTLHTPDGRPITLDGGGHVIAQILA